MPRIKLTKRSANLHAVLLGLLLPFWLLALASPGAQAANQTSSWQGTVIQVIDGDTLLVRPLRGSIPRKIRLDGIDAPEICQSHGGASRDLLARQLMGKQVQLKVRWVDTYGRALSQVSLNGRNINEWMVSQGGAWSYRYRRDPGPYAQQETQARSRGLGVFADAQAERPRDFRLRHGSCH